jgi:hypothetical protein
LTAELSEVEQPVQEAEAKQDAACQEDLDLLQVRLTTDGVVCLDGIVRIPLELEIGGVMRRLLVSVAIEQVDLNPNQVPDPGLELSL